MTFRHAKFEMGPISHSATKVETWNVQLSRKGDSYFAKISGTNSLYSGKLGELAKQVAGHDKTYSRSYKVVGAQATLPHSSKPIRGTAAATPEEVAEFEAMVSQQLTEKRTEPSQNTRVNGHEVPDWIRREGDGRSSSGFGSDESEGRQYSGSYPWLRW